MDTEDKIQEADKLAFSRWLAGLDTGYRQAVLATGLNPWDRYAMSSRPDRAMFFRVSRFDLHQNHIHLELTCYTHEGQPFCLVGPVEPETLVPYPYTTSSPPPPAVVELERRVVESARRLNEAFPEEGEERRDMQAVVGAVLALGVARDKKGGH